MQKLRKEVQQINEEFQSENHRLVEILEPLKEKEAGAPVEPTGEEILHRTR